MKKANLFYYFI